MKARRIAVPFLPLLAGAVLSWLVGCGERTKGIPLPQREGYIMGGNIAFDGTHFWATQYPKLDRIDEPKEIVKFDKTGKVTDVFTPEQNFHGLAFDGEKIWTADAFGWEAGRFFGQGGNFYTVDPVTGVLNREFVLSEIYDDLNGLAAGANRLWAFIHRDVIFEIDPVSGSVVNQVRIPESVNCTAMKYAHGYLWAVTGLMLKEVLKIDPQTGEILKTYDYKGRIINGIATDGDNIYLVDGDRLLLFPMRR